MSVPQECDHPDHFDALYTATRCPGCQTTEKERAQRAYPDHHPETALANYRAGREVWDTNGDMR